MDALCSFFFLSFFAGRLAICLSHLTRRRPPKWFETVYMSLLVRVTALSPSRLSLGLAGSVRTSLLPSPSPSHVYESNSLHLSASRSFHSCSPSVPLRRVGCPFPASFGRSIRVRPRSEKATRSAPSIQVSGTQLLSLVYTPGSSFVRSFVAFFSFVVFCGFSTLTVLFEFASLRTVPPSVSLSVPGLLFITDIPVDYSIFVPPPTYPLPSPSVSSGLTTSIHS